MSPAPRGPDPVTSPVAEGGSIAYTRSPLEVVLAKGPLRATLTVTLREYKTLQNQLDELRLSSPDRTHVHVLEQGETLAAVATRYYDKPVAWRAVAEANGVDDPRRLSPGTFLTVPPLS